MASRSSASSDILARRMP